MTFETRLSTSFESPNLPSSLSLSTMTAARVARILGIIPTINFENRKPAYGTSMCMLDLLKSTIRSLHSWPVQLSCIGVSRSFSTFLRCFLTSLSVSTSSSNFTRSSNIASPLKE